ncbi:amidohydrolase family protein [Pseudaestuariivita sp.]|uniref:amidohydrolase family protein n=1 Tax=Pseudaestuariivita sp. TaxID=2211669 RepID=UPI0040589EE5
MTDFLITNIAHGLVGDAAGTRFSGALRVRDGLVAEIGDLAREPGERVLDARGTVVTPGLVNTHHHLFQSLLKAVPDGINAGLDTWLQKCPYAFWPFIDAETLRVSAQVGLAEVLLSGATTVCDHHYLFAPQYDYDPAEVLFDEAAKFGIRFLLARGGNTKGREYFDDPSLPPAFFEPAAAFLASVKDAARRWHDPSDLAMTRMALAPTTPIFNLDPHELPLFADAARDIGLRLHSHLSENQTYVDYTLREYGQRPVPWLAERGWTGPDVWFAHLVEIDAAEQAHLVETGTAMAHCTQANARLGSGIAPADLLHAQGGIVSIGVDGAGANEAADMGAAMYSAFATHRATKGVNSTRAETVLHWATQGGARTLGFDRIGTLEVGKAADIALFDLSHPRNFGLHDPALAPVITGAAQVRDSFVGGKPVVVDGRLPSLDLAELRAEAEEKTARLIALRAGAVG